MQFDLVNSRTFKDLWNEIQGLSSTSPIYGHPAYQKQTLYFCPVVSFYLLSFFIPRLISAAKIGCLPYFHTWCGSSANLECRSEMCYTQLAGNTARKNDAKKSPSAHHRQLTGSTRVLAASRQPYVYPLLFSLPSIKLSAVSTQTLAFSIALSSQERKDKKKHEFTVTNNRSENK